MRTTHLFCFATAVLLTGCDQNGAPFRSEAIKATPLEGKVRGTRSGGEQIRVWRDQATGCSYLLWDGRRLGGMTPRLTTDGRPMCGPEDAPVEPVGR